MKTYSNFLILPVFLIISWSCSSSQAKKEQTDTGEAGLNDMVPVAAGTQIPAGQCRIIATLLSVDESSITENRQDPCSRAACLAEVQIDSVLGYGSGFNATLTEKQKLNVRFVFTTEPTHSLGLDLERHLPGIKPGEMFRTDVEYRPVFGGGGEFVVGLYEIVKN